MKAQSHPSRLLFLLVVVVLNGGCVPVRAETSSLPIAAQAPVPTPSPTRQPTYTPFPTYTALPTTVRSPCQSVLTPQPTLTPGPNAPRPAIAVGSITPVLPTPTGPSQLVNAQFYSASLDREMPVLVYLPPGYANTTRQYPVLYMLSGFAGDEHEWVNWGMCDALETLIRSGVIQPLIVVMPDGDHSWWFNHAVAPGSDGKPYGDYVWKDVVGYVDATYRTLPQPASRAVGGLSAGGQGAFLFALTHPEVFSIAGAHSPSIRHADGSLAFFGTQEYFNQYDPLWLFANTQTAQKLTLWMDVAAEDKQWGDSIHKLHDTLVSLDIPHEWHDTWHGIHDDYYWSAHLDDYLVWYASKLAGAP